MWNGEIVKVYNSKSVDKWQDRTIVQFYLHPLASNYIVALRVVDNNAYMCIIDEMSTFFGLNKAGTLRAQRKNYNYTYYSFMSGEKPYKHDDDEFNFQCAKWKYYLSWWNIQASDEWFYLRPYYNTYKLICYPRRVDIENEITSYDVKALDNNPEYMIRWWLNCKTNDDIHRLIGESTTYLDKIVNRIEPKMIIVMTLFISRLRNFLFYFLQQ